MTKTEAATQWMEQTAKDDRHGYDQKYRWGERGDYDCSSSVITAWQNSGVPVKTKGATYTGNMYDVFRKCGFQDVTKTVNLRTGAGLKRGDVLLNRQHHVAMYCGNGKEVEASINEKGKAVGGVPGDQTGKEFLIRSYRNYPWTDVLRYKEPAPKPTKSVSQIAKEVIAGKWGKGDDRKNRLTAAGYDYAAVQKEVNELYAIASKKSIDTVAREVIAGKWGTGQDRVNRLEKAGYDAVQVQHRVNELMG